MGILTFLGAVVLTCFTIIGVVTAVRYVLNTKPQKTGVKRAEQPDLNC